MDLHRKKDRVKTKAAIRSHRVKSHSHSISSIKKEDCEDSTEEEEEEDNVTEIMQIPEELGGRVISRGNNSIVSFS